MKAEIQPNYMASKIICACGNVIETNSTKPEMKVDICSKCHPYWTGSLKQNTTGGRADKFKKKYGILICVGQAPTTEYYSLFSPQKRESHMSKRRCHTHE